MLTLAAGQVECLRDAVLPVECGICRRISRGRIGCWPTRRCCADRAGGRRLGTLSSSAAACVSLARRRSAGGSWWPAIRCSAPRRIRPESLDVDVG